MNLQIPVVFKNEDIVVVDKPVGISIHNAEDPTNLIRELESQLAAERLRLFPVHRLDKETSGIQIFAFNERAAAQFAGEFQSRSVRKVYLGLLRGSMKLDDGAWVQPLTDKSEGRVNPAGTARDRIACETRFRVLKKSKFFTLCEFDLVTGRQHQIRKHAAINGHALVGDGRYGDKKYNDRMRVLYEDDRMFLHCASVELLGRRYDAPLPENFRNLVDGSRSSGH